MNTAKVIPSVWIRRFFLDAFRTTPSPLALSCAHFWIVEDDVLFIGRWAALFDVVAAYDATAVAAASLQPAHSSSPRLSWSFSVGIGDDRDDDEDHEGSSTDTDFPDANGPLDLVPSRWQRRGPRWAWASPRTQNLIGSDGRHQGEVGGGDSNLDRKRPAVVWQSVEPVVRISRRYGSIIPGLFISRLVVSQHYEPA